MRYPASEKLEIIRTVETSHLPVRKTLDKIGIPCIESHAPLALLRGFQRIAKVDLTAQFFVRRKDIVGRCGAKASQRTTGNQC
jgi:hypothetical protein